MLVNFVLEIKNDFDIFIYSRVVTAEIYIYSSIFKRSLLANVFPHQDRS